MSRHNQFDDSGSDDEDDLDAADMEAIRLACLRSNDADSTTADQSKNSGDGGIEESDSDSDDEDIATLRDIRNRLSLTTELNESLFMQPLCTLYPDLSEFDDGDENDDLETIQAIQRRFSAYSSGISSNSTKDILQKPEHSSVITSENRTSDSLFSNQIDSEEASSDPSLSNEWAQNESSTFPKSAQFFMDAIKRNRCYQKVLRSKLIQIEARIEENKKLRERVGILKNFQVSCRKITGRALSQRKDPHVMLISTKNSTNESKGSDTKSFPKHFGPEENSHVANYRAALSQFVLKLEKSRWSEAERQNLEKGIRRQFQEMMLQVSINNSSCLDGFFGDTHSVDNICTSVKDRELTPEEIRKFLPKVNWGELACTYVQGRTGAECEARWLNCEDPLINRNPWSIEEEKSLLIIVQERGITNWFDITTLLGTNRTPFQCLAHYQRSLNVSILERDWTVEEDERLRIAVDTFGEKNWQAVASILKRRTGTQCSNRWKKSLHIEKKGRWTMDEVKRLKVAVTLLGPKNWNIIAQYVPGRSQAQCRERWVESLDPSLNFGSWSEDEDIRLDEAVAQYGYCWKDVAVYLPSRTRKQCMRRWKALHPDLVPLLQEARRKQKAVSISNFVDRECERPALGPNDLIPLPILEPDSEPLDRKPTKKRKGRPSRKTKPEKEKDEESCIPTETRKSTRRRKTNQKYSDEVLEVSDDEHEFIPKKKAKRTHSADDNWQPDQDHSLPAGRSETERPSSTSNEKSKPMKLQIRRAPKKNIPSSSLTEPSGDENCSWDMSEVETVTGCEPVSINLEIDSEDDNITLARYLAKRSKKMQVTPSNNGSSSKMHILSCTSNLRLLKDAQISVPNGTKPAQVHLTDYCSGAHNNVTSEHASGHPEVHLDIRPPCFLTYKRRKWNPAASNGAALETTSCQNDGNLTISEPSTQHTLEGGNGTNRISKREPVNTIMENEVETDVIVDSCLMRARQERQWENDERSIYTEHGWSLPT